MTTNELALIRESGAGKMFNNGDDVASPDYRRHPAALN